MVSPSCVSFSEMLRPTPAATILSMHRRGRSRVAASASAHVGDALAEEVERLRQPGGLDDARRGDRLFDGFAGDEAAREAAWPAHAVARRERLQDAAAGERVEEGLGDRLDHQWVRGEPAPAGEQVLDRARVVAEHGALADAERVRRARCG